MKKLLTLIALLTCFLGAKAELAEDYRIEYANYYGFPFYVMDYVPEWIDGVMTDMGGSYKYVTLDNEEGQTSDVIVSTHNGVQYYRIPSENTWHQYFIATGITTKVDGAYTVKAMVRASEACEIKVDMRWSWDENPKSTTISIGTEWQLVEWNYSGIGGTSCNLIAQPNTAAKIEWQYVAVYHDVNFMDVVTRMDVPLTFTNDDKYPWAISGEALKNGNCGVKNSLSKLTMNFSSAYKTELSFDWLCRNYSNHSLSILVDGVQTNTTTTNSYNTIRLYIEPGQHVIVFRDTIGNSTSTNNYSYIKNVKIKEISPLENAVLTGNSQPLTFTNNSKYPWTIEDGYIQNGNWSVSQTASRFSTTFTIDKTSKFCYEVAIPEYDTYYTDGSYQSRHQLLIYINGIYYDYWQAQRDWTLDEIGLEPGTYTIEFVDTLKYGTGYYAKIRNIEVSNNWIDVDLATAGTLGYEVLYSGKASVLTDVEFLKIKGPLNAADWTDIMNMTNLIALDLSEAQITEIPNKAFDGKGELESVILPEGITLIGEYAFRGTNIRRINIPSTVTTISQYAFISTPLQYLTFAKNSQIETIGQFAFASCSSLQSIDFGENTKLSTINNAAFYNCKALRDVVVPNTVTSMGYSVFQDCSSLKSLLFPDGITFINDHMCSGCSSLEQIQLPKNLVRINYAAFNGTGSLKRIDIPKTVNEIRGYAFQNSGLDSIALPVSLEYLYACAFNNCKSLKYIEMPSYLMAGEKDYYTRYYWASGSSITNDYGSEGGRYYGYYRNFINCTALEKVVMRSATPPTISSDPFTGASAKSNITLVVPSFAVVSYKLDTYWYQFGNIVEGDDVDYWKITSPLMLTNNRRMQGKPDVDLYYGGQLTVGGNAPFPMGQFNMFVNESNPGRLLNTCDDMTAEQATTKFYAEANKWFFFTPLHDVNIADIQVSNNASYVFRYYDAQNRATNGASGSWKNVDTDKLYAGQGYIFHCNTACTITFPVADANGQSQLFRTGDVSRTLTVNEATTTANRSWNYVGNPYPCYYDIYYMDFTAPITVWTGSTYKAYSVADDEFALRPMQSFFVQKPDAVDAIVFHKEGRQLTTDITHNAAAPARAAAISSRHIFNIAIENEEQQDVTRVVINNEASMSYEVEHDAAKFMSMDASVPQLLTLDSEGNSYAINERPIDNGQVRLAYYAGEEGFYTIRALRADGEVSLYDAELDKTVDITSEDYTFQSNATGGVNSSRFVLTFKVVGMTGIANVKDKMEEVGGEYFNLAGQRVAQPAKGLYIQNGKKVVRK